MTRRDVASSSDFNGGRQHPVEQAAVAAEGLEAREHRAESGRPSHAAELRLEPEGSLGVVGAGGVPDGDGQLGQGVGQARDEAVGAEVGRVGEQVGALEVAEALSGSLGGRPVEGARQGRDDVLAADDPRVVGQLAELGEARAGCRSRGRCR